MCLYVDKDKTKEELLNRETRTFYKLFLKKECHLETPYLHYKIKGPGKIKAVPTGKPFTDMIGAGVFHARLSQDGTKPDKFFIEYLEFGKFVCLPITVEAEDLVAFGGLGQDNACMKAYTISQNDWDSVWK